MAAALVEGTFSSVGRNTGRSLARLKTKVALGDAELNRKKMGGSFSDSLQSRGSGGSLSPMARSVRHTLGVSGSFGGGSSFGVGAAAGDFAAAEVDSKATGEDTEAEEPASPSDAKLDHCFASQGQDHQRFDDNAAAVLGRWVAPCKLEERPPIAHYRASLDLVKVRTPKWDFSKTLGRKPIVPQVLEEPASPGESMELTSTISRRSHATTAPSSSSYLSVCKPHADLAGPKALAPGRTWTGATQLQNKMVSTAPEDMLDQDRNLSTVPRRPECDFVNVLDRKMRSRETFFEPGKYKIKWDAVGSATKSSASHDKMTSRETPLRSHSSPAAALDHDGLEGNDGIIYNRCLHRDTSETRVRVTHVMDMRKVTERPPFFQAASVYYDMNDSEACAKTLQQEMALDKSLIDKAVTTRRNQGPDMSRALPRNGRGRGFRLLQGDLGMRASLGCVYPECVHQREGDAEACKESPSRPRSDMTVSFEQTKGRQKGSSLNLSSLRKPREMAFGDFERVAPRNGFAPRVSANIPQVLRPNRTFEALPGFDASLYDSCEWDDL